MAETLQAPLRDPSDIKIFILYLLDRLAAPLDFAEINDIVVQNGVVKPFDFCLTFPDLLETGHIQLHTDGNKETYTVTPLGHEVASSLNGKILNTTKEKALKNAVLLLNMRKTNTGYSYNIKQLPNGKYVFQLSYTKEGEEVLALSVTTETQKEAENMEIEFEQHPDMFRRALLSLLTNNADAVCSYAPFRLL